MHIPKPLDAGAETNRTRTESFSSDPEDDAESLSSDEEERQTLFKRFQPKVLIGQLKAALPPKKTLGAAFPLEHLPVKRAKYAFTSIRSGAPVTMLQRGIPPMNSTHNSVAPTVSPSAVLPEEKRALGQLAQVSFVSAAPKRNGDETAEFGSDQISK